MTLFLSKLIERFFDYLELRRERKRMARRRRAACR
jgi:hypothetical protein